jgi:hypothetical protein
MSPITVIFPGHNRVRFLDPAIENVQEGGLTLICQSQDVVFLAAQATA